MKYMKLKYIKTSHALIVATLAVGAISARADWVVVGPADITVHPGESGSSTYQFTIPTPPPTTGIINSESSSYQVEGSGVNLSITGSTPITSYLPGTSPVGETVDGGATYDITVDWTISSDPAFIGDEYSANYGISTDAYGDAAAAQNIIIVAAPEPAQFTAGGLLLGCGAVIFGVRRLQGKKPSAA